MDQRGKQVDQELFDVVLRGIEKTFDNAERLFQEADILAKFGAIARALLLHQISLEECSKADSLGAWAISLIVGYHVDQHKILNKMHSHEAKNKSNAYMLKASDAELAARTRGDRKSAQEEFKKIQIDFHKKSNKAKNASLYVDWNNDEFLSPSEAITSEMLADIKKQNLEFLGNTHAALRMLKRLKESPNYMTEMQGLLTDFVGQVGRLREEMPDITGEAINNLVANFLDIAAGSLISPEGEG